MVDLEEWSNEELEKRVDVVLSLFHKVKKGEKISLLDFAPEYREILRDKTYGPWFPTGDSQFISFSPLSNARVRIAVYLLGARLLKLFYLHF